jgi:hypothetical protein
MGIMSALTGYIRALLIADTTTYGYVGSRIYPKKLPLNVTIPALVLSEAPGTKTEALKDNHTRLQVTIFGGPAPGKAAYDVACDITDAVKNALIKQTGSRNGVYVNDIYHIIDVEGDSSEPLIDVVHSDFGVIWEKH